MKPKAIAALVLITAGLLFLAACSGAGSATSADTSSPANKPTTSDEALKKSPKDSIAYQFGLLKEGNVSQLRECFTERVRGNITDEAVEKGKLQSSNYSLDDLVASVEMGEAEGHSTAKIMMKNGRTLTTLIQVENKWLADTVWFK
jgi:glutamine cyclotransferase